MKFSVGDKVMALWPGSGLYYPAEIKRIVGDRADILYSDGTEMEVFLKQIKTEDYFKKRPKSPSRRGRSRSPARSPSRKSRTLQKSDRTPKRPKSRSVSRGRPKKATTTPVQKSRSVSRGRVTVSSSSAASSSDESVTKKVRISEVTIDSRYMVTRQRAKVSATKEEISSLLTTTEPVEYEFGGVFGSFIMYFASPVGALFLILTSIKAKWSISEFNQSIIPCTWEAYFSIKAFAIVLGFMLFHAIIYALPFGYIIKGPATVRGKQLEYRISARYTLFFTILAYAALHYYKVPILQVHDELFRLAVAATVVAVVGNTAVYIASFWAPKEELNPQGNTSSIIYDSFIGRWTHPRFGKHFDLKLYLYRPCMAGWLVMIWIEMYREYDANGEKHDTAFLLVAVSQIFYIIMEFFYDEELCPYMFDIKNESLGFLQFVGELVVVPFLYNLQVRYLATFHIQLKLPNTLLFALFTVMGFSIHILATYQKSLFRRNPYDHRIAHYLSLPSSRPDGQRVLTSGLWGVVRQPHYLGEIFIGLSWSVLCGFRHLLAWCYPFLIIGLLVHRSQRVEARNLKKHGATWKVYREKVKYRIIPGVY